MYPPSSHTNVFALGKRSFLDAVASPKDLWYGNLAQGESYGLQKYGEIVAVDAPSKWFTAKTEPEIHSATGIVEGRATA